MHSGTRDSMEMRLKGGQLAKAKAECFWLPSGWLRRRLVFVLQDFSVPLLRSAPLVSVC